MSLKDHWQAIYESKPDAKPSWTQPEPRLSMDLIQGICPAGRVIDVGGGSSVLAERLLTAGYSVAVLDISDAALARARAALGPKAAEIRWIVADVTAPVDLEQFDVWHDRAVFHFLTDPADRAAYVALLSRTVPAGGHAIIATFAPDGPEKCGGLPVCRYSGKTLAAALGPAFRLLTTLQQTHLTPRGAPQAFEYSFFERL